MTQEIISAIFVSAAISFTVTTTSIFGGLRELVSKIHHKLEELIFCPWCFNHYVVFTMLLTSNIQLLNISNNYLYNFLFTSFCIIGGAGVLHYVLLRAYEPVQKVMMMRQMEKLQAKRKISEKA